MKVSDLWLRVELGYGTCPPRPATHSSHGLRFLFVAVGRLITAAAWGSL